MTALAIAHLASWAWALGVAFGRTDGWTKKGTSGAVPFFAVFVTGVALAVWVLS